MRHTSGDAAQQLLEIYFRLMLELMGIGSGSSPTWSSEKGLWPLLRDRHAALGHSLSVFDVGAHRGAFLTSVIQPLDKYGIPHSVRAFEPIPQSFAMLQQAFRDCPNVSLNNFALGSQIGESQLHAPAAGSSLSSFSKRRLDHFNLTFDYSETVKVSTLDKYCAEHAINAIDLLKLDVEGHELEVMQGGLGIFRGGVSR